MAINLQIEMANVTEAHHCHVERIKQALIDLSEIDNDADLNTAITDLMKDLEYVGIADVATTLKDFVAHTQNKDLTSRLLDKLEHKPQPFDISENIIERLALAEIYSSADPDKASDLNQEAYFYLGQNLGIQNAIKTFETIQGYYTPDAESEEKYVVSESQKTELDQALLTTATAYLAQDEKDPAVLEKLALLTIQIEDTEASAKIITQLFSHLSYDGRTRYIVAAIDHASEHMDDHEVIKNPILASAGKTYGEMFSTLGRFGVTVSPLVEYEKPTEPAL